MEEKRSPLVKPGRRKIGLLSLPNETLLKILENSALGQDLLALGTVCHRLHSIALSLVFRRHGIVNPVQDIHLPVPNSLDTSLVRSLQNALFLRHTINLECDFSKCRDLEVIMVQTRELVHFVDGLDFVSAVTITFPQDMQPRSDVEWLCWRLLLTRFMRAVLRKGCSALTVTGGTPQYLPPPTEHAPGRPLRTKQSPLAKIWRWLTNSTLWSHPRNLRTQLTTITIRNATPALEILAESTYSPDLTSLSLIDITAHSNAWASTLSSLANSTENLHHLSVTNCVGIPQPSIYQVLEISSELRSFTYDTDTDGTFQPAEAPSLPHLEQLHARSDMVLTLLSGQVPRMKNLVRIQTYVFSPQTLWTGWDEMMNFRIANVAIQEIVERLKHHLPAEFESSSSSALFSSSWIPSSWSPWRTFSPFKQTPAATLPPVIRPSSPLPDTSNPESLSTISPNLSIPVTLLVDVCQLRTPSYPTSNNPAAHPLQGVIQIPIVLRYKTPISSQWVAPSTSASSLTVPAVMSGGIFTEKAVNEKGVDGHDHNAAVAPNSVLRRGGLKRRNAIRPAKTLRWWDEV